MPFRRLTDYTGLLTWGVTVIFFGGMLYHSDSNQTVEIEKLQSFAHKHDSASNQLNTRVTTLEVNQANQMIWQNTMLETLQSMTSEVKINNERSIRIETKVENIEDKLK